MGRKIPGKKHHGVKDPLKQLAKRNAGLNLNAPPINPDEQEVPKSAIEIRKLQQMVKDGKFSKRQKHKKGNNLLNTKRLISHGPRLPGMKRPDKKLPILIQDRGESDENFLYRLNEATEEIINEARLEEAHSVMVKRDDHGKVDNVINDMDEINEKPLIKNTSKLKWKKKKKNNEQIEEGKKKRHLSRRQKLKLKRAAKLAGEENEKDFNNFSDKVKFGEVVHRPPELKALPKGASTSSTNKPGVKSLILKGLFTNSLTNRSNKTPLSMATKKRLEAQRLDAVAAYRNLKKGNKNSN